VARSETGHSRATAIIQRYPKQNWDIFWDKAGHNYERFVFIEACGAAQPAGFHRGHWKRERAGFAGRLSTAGGQPNTDAHADAAPSRPDRHADPGADRDTCGHGCPAADRAVTAGDRDPGRAADSIAFTRATSDTDPRANAVSSRTAFEAWPGDFPQRSSYLRSAANGQCGVG
jgi:hypothetical protein